MNESFAARGGMNFTKDFIEKGKYDNLKDEILQNDDNEVSIRNYNIMLYKSIGFMKTEKVKSMKLYASEFDMFAYYGIPNGTVIQIHHIQAVIGYTDYSKLASSVTASMRRQHPNESLLSIKSRNAHYYWMSKYLSEAVNGYGDDRITETLYCGMNRPLIMPSMSLTFQSATSTTTELTVAHVFATNDGVILEITDPVTTEYILASRLNVSWLSRYKEEAERLWVQSINGSMALVSMRMCINDKFIKYQTPFKVLFLIDAMCKRSILQEAPISKDEEQIYDGILKS